MTHQKELFRTSILCKLVGHLVLIKVNPFSPKGVELKCPNCKNTRFKNDDYGWITCTECWDFSLLKSHVEEIESQRL